tara:strand:+ start:3431 stop:3760 length:330 start_codon:yes stop_codon:yes gene_type:complete
LKREHEVFVKVREHALARDARRRARAIPRQFASEPRRVRVDILRRFVGARERDARDARERDERARAGERARDRARARGEHGLESENDDGCWIVRAGERERAGVSDGYYK